MRAYVEAYGCTLNFGESREVEDLLASKGWDIVRDPEDADLAVLATCVVVEKTERAMLKRLAELRDVPKLIVTGCMARTCREKAESVVPEALFVGPGDLQGIASALGSDTQACRPSSVPRDSYAIVPIASGCLGTCSYCITRLARGKLRSRPEVAIVDAVRALVSGGPREVQLTAQDTAAYGADIGSSLPRLVREVCRIPHDFRLRVGMMNPRSVLAEMSSVADMYRQHKVFKFLHLPIQSGSDRVLGDMERGYTMDQVRRILSEVRSVAPELSFSTDLIVGYPGETEADHELSLRAISDTSPDIVNVTKFSARPGTRAAMSAEKVAGSKAKDRSREITVLRFKVALDLNRRWVGRTVPALSTERGKGRSTIFRTDEYRQIVVSGILPLGEFRSVRVTDATATYLHGELEATE